MNNNNNIIRESHEKLMKADPFLVEALHAKTNEELQDKLLTLTNQLSFVSKQSPSWYTNHKETMDVIETILLLRRIEEQDGGGVSLI